MVSVVPQLLQKNSSGSLALFLRFLFGRSSSLSSDPGLFDISSWGDAGEEGELPRSGTNDGEGSEGDVEGLSAMGDEEIIVPTGTV